MKKLLLAGVCAGLLPLAGCADVTSFLASPTTGAAATNALKFTTAFACGLSAAAATAQGVAVTPVNGSTVVDAQGQAIIGIVYVSSTAACKLLGGVVTSAAVSVPTTSVVQ